MSNRKLPPKVGAIENGSVKWQSLEEVDYELLGYFLSCHLIIEHYLDQSLKILHPKLGWDEAKPTFAQKVAFMSTFEFPVSHDPLPAIKHMNAVRNKLSHRVAFKLRDDDLLPFIHFLQKSKSGEETLPSDAHSILDMFTGVVCAFFAGVVSASAHHLHRPKHVSATAAQNGIK